MKTSEVNRLSMILGGMYGYRFSYSVLLLIFIQLGIWG